MFRHSSGQVNDCLRRHQPASQWLDAVLCLWLGHQVGRWCYILWEICFFHQGSTMDCVLCYGVPCRVVSCGLRFRNQFEVLTVKRSSWLTRNGLSSVRYLIVSDLWGEGEVEINSVISIWYWIDVFVMQMYFSHEFYFLHQLGRMAAHKKKDKRCKRESYSCSLFYYRLKELEKYAYLP